MIEDPKAVKDMKGALAYWGVPYSALEGCLREVVEVFNAYRRRAFVTESARRSIECRLRLTRTCEEALAGKTNQSTTTTMSSSNFDQAQYKRLKTRLTKCLNRLKAIPDKDREAKREAACAVQREVLYAAERFAETGYPDQWSRWERAGDDAHFLIRRLGGDR